MGGMKLESELEETDHTPVSTSGVWDYPLKFEFPLLNFEIFSTIALKRFPPYDK